VNHIKLSLLPENYVSLITSTFIRLENLTQNAVEAIKKLNAFTDTDIIDNKKFWKMPFSDKVELAEKLKELNRIGFLFVGGGTAGPLQKFSLSYVKRNS